jgi:hypothetical protein
MPNPTNQPPPKQWPPKQWPPKQWRPTLLSSCAQASTAAETRFRIDAPAFTRRTSRIIALDTAGAAALQALADGRWDGGHFLAFESALPDDALLRRVPGPGGGADTASTSLLSEELDGADTVVMVASAEGNATAASIIGDAAAARAIMSAGLVIPGNGPSGEVVTALRPNAMVLVVLREATDLPEVLSALRV